MTPRGTCLGLCRIWLLWSFPLILLINDGKLDWLELIREGHPDLVEGAMEDNRLVPEVNASSKNASRMWIWSSPICKTLLFFLLSLIILLYILRYLERAIPQTVLTGFLGFYYTLWPRNFRPQSFRFRNFRCSPFK